MPDESSPPPLPIVILGTDAVLAAAPSTAVQLAHACLASGYAAVVPASWGDELIATECLRRVGTRGREPVLCVVCPHVADRLLEAGSDLAPFTVSLVPPPVAAARYLRAMCGDEQVRITFVGACPAGNDESIDEHVVPDAFLARLDTQGIVISEQPQVFDSVIPPDRRRFQSLPGGVPTADSLWNDAGRALIEVDDEDFVADIAQRLVSREHSLLDVAPKLGCACSGAVPGIAPRSARVAVAATEPPRASRAVVDPAVQVDLVRPLPPAQRQRRDLLGGAATPARPGVTAPSASSAISDPARQAAADRTGRTPPSPQGMAGSESSTPKRRVSGAVARAAGAMPTVNSGEGRVLPRAYVARRRTGRTPPGNPSISQDSPQAPGTDAERPAATTIAVPGSLPVPPGPAGLPAPRAMRTLEEIARSALDHTRKRPMALAALIGLMALVFVLLGLAAGWWITGVGERATPSSEANANEAPRSEAQTLFGAPDDSASRTVERAGSVGPELTAPRPSPPAGVNAPASRRTASPAAARPTRQPPGGRAAAVRTARPVPAAPPEPASVDQPLPATKTIAPSESATVRQAPVVPPIAAPSRRDSIDRELQAIARELQLRRARIDSIARSQALPSRPER